MSDRRPEPRAVRAHYERLAPRYESRWRRYIQASNRSTLHALRPRPGERLLDVGCGTGAFLALLGRSGSGAGAVGVDPSTAMLTHAVRSRRGYRLAAGGAEALPFKASTFDAVVSTSALHFVPAPHAALAEMARVVRPGGRVVITDWCADYLSIRLLDRWLALRDPAHGRPLTGAEAIDAMRSAGFVDLRMERFRIGLWWGMMTLAARRDPDRAVPYASARM